MSKYARAKAMDDDSDRMGKLAKPGGVEGNTDHAQGEYSRANAMTAAKNILNKQVARGSSAPVVGGRKMTDY